jgi:hypothetical protein
VTRLISVALVVGLGSSAAAVAETRIYSNADGGSFPVKPTRLEYSKSQSGAGGPVTLKHLSWRNWGEDAAESDGTMKACPEVGGCFVIDAELKAKKKQRSGGASYYTKLVVSFGQNRIKIGLPLPSG